MADITSYATGLIARQMKGINDAIVDKNELSRNLKKKGRIKYGCGGDSIKWRVFYNQPTVFGSTTDTGSRTAYTIQPFTTAEVRYVQYDGEILMFLMQLMRNKNGEENVKLFDQLKEELNVFKQSIFTTLGKHMYEGTASTYGNNRGTNLSGLVDIVSTTGTYAGIARSGNTWWQSQAASCSSPELDTDGNDVPELVEMLRSLWMDCSGGSGDAHGDNPGSVSPDLAGARENPDLGFTTKAIHINYQNCLSPQMRYKTGDSRDPQAPILFNNMELYWDNFCTSGKVYFINSNFLEINCVTDELLVLDPQQQGVLVPGRNAKTWTAVSQLQMLSRNPRYHGLGTVS